MREFENSFLLIKKFYFVIAISNIPAPSINLALLKFKQNQNLQIIHNCVHAFLQLHMAYLFDFS